MQVLILLRKILSISSNDVLKIWDIYNGDIKSSKVLNNGDLLYWIEWEKNKIMYYYNNEIIIYDYNCNNIIYRLKKENKKQRFKFIDTNNIIILTNLKNKKLQVKKLSLEEKQENIIFEKEGINYSIFLYIVNYLILFDDLNITIYEINNNNIKQIQNDNNNDYDFNNILHHSFSKISNKEILLKLDM